jgi:hypothetical protein
MSQLTRRKTGRSDNNEAGETLYFDVSMAWRIGSMFEHRKAARLWPYSAILGRRVQEKK